VANQFFEESASNTIDIVVDCSKINFVFTGRIVKEKGIIELIRALSKLKDMANWHLHVIGSFGSSFGSNNQVDNDNLVNENEIKKEFAAIAGFYTVHGYIKNELIPNLYKNFDIAFSPSICKDAAPLVIGEYICCNIPVVASDQGGIPEYLNSDCGVIVRYDKNFVDNLSSAISNLLKNPVLLEMMSNNCEVHKNSFSSKEYYNNLLEIIKSN
jgi:glycosyltransferase involved in cell wall biosynthesis